MGYNAAKREMKKSLLALLFITISFLAYSQCNTCGGKGYLEQSTPCASCKYGYVETTVTRDCSNCYGRGTVSKNCDNCGGKGYTYHKNTSRCSVCGGSGYKKTKVSLGQCPDCKGTGNTSQSVSSWSSGTRCPRCNGQGNLYQEKETYCNNCERGYVSKVEQVTCSVCHGNRQVSVTCPRCQGQRRSTEHQTTRCSVCGGSGKKTVRNTCPTCHGGFR